MVASINFIIASLLFSAPRNMPPLSTDKDASNYKEHIISTSDYGARKNHPTSYDDNPSFKGPLKLDQRASPDMHRKRIYNYYREDAILSNSLQVDGLPSLASSTPTKTIINEIVNHLARRDAPVDAKEVAESVEFYLRVNKRIYGASKRILQNNAHDVDDQRTITIQDLCSGHGLTGMLFLACTPPGRIPNTSVRIELVDKVEPKSHSILRDCISEICPWVSEDTVSFVSTPLNDYTDKASNKKIHGNEATIVISTHACGSLTDKVLEYSINSEAASLAVMPCCYTGTDEGAPYGVRRMLGVGLSADVRRSFYLQENNYHADFGAIPRAVTPMNRIIVAERRK